MKYVLSVIFSGLLFLAFIPTAKAESERSNSSKVVHERFKLDVEDKVIIKTDYQSTMTVRVNPRHSKGISLRVGSAVFAHKINLRLRNVKGYGTFHIKLGKLTDNIELERE